MSELRFKGLTIGIPKEIMGGERRVSATPETVAKMILGGAQVVVEKSAGEGAFIADEEYSSAGARLAGTEEVFAGSDVILKVKEPVFNARTGRHETDMMKAGQVLVTFLHPAAPTNYDMVRQLAAGGILSFTLDSIPRITRAQTMDALTSMSTVAGYKSVLMAANLVPKFMPMIGSAVGMIRPAGVLVIGTGVAGLQAAATAKRLGAVVHAIDIRPEATEHARSLGINTIDPCIPAEICVGEGGYAKRLPDEWLAKEREIIREWAIKSDIVIATALVPGKLAPILITAEMVRQMKPGSAIMDISIDQGGNCELTVGGEMTEHHGVLIDGTKNIPGMVPVSSTWMFSHNIFNFVSYLFKDGKLELNPEDEIIKSSLVTRNGQILHEGAREAMGLS
jgi:NAD(P) transhydrogenase subunit alpha